jgi:hypothetical protein
MGETFKLERQLLVDGSLLGLGSVPRQLKKLRGFGSILKAIPHARHSFRSR